MRTSPKHPKCNQNLFVQVANKARVRIRTATAIPHVFPQPALPAGNGLKPLMWFSLNLTVYGQFNTSTSHRSPAPAMITAWDYGPAGGDADSDVLSCWLAPGPPSQMTIDRKCGTEFATQSTSMPWAWCTSTSLASRMLMEVGGLVGFFPLSSVQKEACL